MRKVKIITDSCSDLTVELMEKFNIDYVKMNTVYEGKETPADLAWTKEQAHELYEIMRKGNRITTTQVPVTEFEKVFTKYAELGMDIVYIACSIRLTSSMNTGAVVAKKLMEKYEGLTIKCVDSFNSAIGEGIIAMEAAKKAEEGKTPDEIENYIVSMRKTVNEFATVLSLDTLKKAGRVSASSAFFGNLIGIKPILVQDVDGCQAAYKKVKGRQNSLKEIVSLMKAAIRNPENQTIYLCHADCSPDEIQSLYDLVKQEIPCKDIYVSLIGPIVGASTGPDTVGLWAIGEEVTFRGGDK